jgi:hypothetical protein
LVNGEWRFVIELHCQTVEMAKEAVIFDSKSPFINRQ